MAEARNLNSAELEALQAGLDLAARLANSDGPPSLDQVQILYDAFLAEYLDDSDAIIALGLAFGQCIVSSGPFEWVRCIDEYGDETSVSVVGAAIYIHPISMIQKRLASRERVVIEQLCDDSLAQLAGLVNKGGYAKR